MTISNFVFPSAIILQLCFGYFSVKAGRLLQAKGIPAGAEVLHSSGFALLKAGGFALSATALYSKLCVRVLGSLFLRNGFCGCIFLGNAQFLLEYYSKLLWPWFPAGPSGEEVSVVLS